MPLWVKVKLGEGEDQQPVSALEGSPKGFCFAQDGSRCPLVNKILRLDGRMRSFDLRWRAQISRIRRRSLSDTRKWGGAFTLTVRRGNCGGGRACREGRHNRHPVGKAFSECKVGTSQLPDVQHLLNLFLGERAFVFSITQNVELHGLKERCSAMSRLGAFLSTIMPSVNTKHSTSGMDHAAQSPACQSRWTNISDPSSARSAAVSPAHDSPANWASRLPPSTVSSKASRGFCSIRGLFER